VKYHSGVTVAVTWSTALLADRASYGGGTGGPTPEHLLISECALTPPAGEYIEIVNPTLATIDLSQYYLADSTNYARVPNGGVTPSPGDFVCKFPPGTNIAPGQVITISTTAITDGFVDTYGVEPDFLLPTGLGSPRLPSVMMHEAFPGSMATHSLTDGGEGVHLFFWDGLSDLVKDVDVVRFGVPNLNNQIVDKTGQTVDGPDADSIASPYAIDAMTMPVMSAAAGSGFSHKRIALEGTNENQGGGGNGITGHDETTENILVSFDGGANPFTAPDPGVSGVAPILCLADIAPQPDGDGAVNVDDLLMVINSWGACPADPAPCPADLAPQPDGDNVVNVDDLLAVINEWGPCPTR
jgi:hypothetical protein